MVKYSFTLRSTFHCSSLSPTKCEAAGGLVCLLLSGLNHTVHPSWKHPTVELAINLQILVFCPHCVKKKEQKEKKHHKMHHAMHFN